LYDTKWYDGEVHTEPPRMNGEGWGSFNTQRHDKLIVTVSIVLR